MILEVGVKALITNAQGNYLILKRKHPYPGDTILKWDIPGGRIVPGEKLEEALAREIKEETGLTFTKIEKILAAQDILRLADKHTIRLTFVVSCKNITNVKLDPQEHTQYQWATVKELQNLPHDTFLNPILETL